MCKLLTHAEIQAEVKKVKKDNKYQIHYDFFKNVIVEDFDFRDIDLGACIMSDSKFRNCKFINIGMGEYMWSTTLDNCTIENADFHKTELGGLKIHKCLFINSSFHRANLIGGIISDSIFEKCHFPACIFSENEITNTKFIDHEGIFRLFRDNKEENVDWSNTPQAIRYNLDHRF